jgi:hypothetical protein
MKKITKFAKEMGHLKNTNDLMNYELKSSNSNNYSSFDRTSSPESFPVLMENSIIVRYELVKFSTELIDVDEPAKNNLT